MTDKETKYFLTKTGKFFKIFLYSPYGSFVIGGLVGFIFFALTYGLKLVDPSFVDWLLQGGDLKQHFLGWEFYRHEAWTFPIGAINGLAYPFGISLSYTDSIPLMAIPLKLFSSWLPANFQYFGLWGLISCVLQGGIAAMITRRWSKNPLVLLLVSTVFVISPIMMMRMFTHTALGSQWLILLAIWAMLARNKIATTRQQVLIWSAIFSLSVLIHPYFLPIVALPFAISIILLHRTWVPTILKGVIPTLIALLVFWIVGGFAVSAGDSEGGGLGLYQLNFTSLLNPLGWSDFIRNYLHSFNGESLNYLGLGIIMLLPVVLFIAFQHYDTPSKIKLLITTKLNFRYLLISLCFAGLIALAMSHRVFFGPHLLVEIDLPQKIISLWSIFQASARLFWPIYYMIVLGVIVYVIKAFNRKSQMALVIFLMLFIGIQVADVQGSPRAEEVRREFAQYNLPDLYYDSPLDSPSWSELASDKEHMVYIDYMSNGDFFALSDIATKYDLTMNTGYFARSPKAKIAEYQKQQIDNLKNNKADLAPNLYITKDDKLAQELKDQGYDIKQPNGFYVIAQSSY